MTTLTDFLVKYRVSEITHPPNQRTNDMLCRPDCPICGGIGFYRLDLQPGQPDFGRIYTCENIPLAKLHAPGDFGLLLDEERQLSWEDSILDLNNAGEAASQVREVLERSWGWVFLWGAYGLAKSLILKVAVAEALRRGVKARFTTAVDLLDDLRLAFDSTKPSRDLIERVRWWSDLQFLAIDELTRVNKTDWANERLFQILNSRYDQAVFGRSLTLIGSNMPPSALEGYLNSRINDGRFLVLKLEGQDIRPGVTAEA